MNAPLAHPLSSAQTDFSARFSTKEFAELFDAALALDIRLELIDGKLARMTPPMGAHSSRQTALIAALWGVVGNRTMAEASIAVREGTVVTCDVGLLYAPMPQPRFLRPDEVFLAIEIAETTLDRDLGLKRQLYAGAGIPHYWVIDGQRRILHRFAEPTDGEYLALGSLRFGEPVPVPGSDATIVLA